MSNENDKIIQGHDYDGILEYDNPLPTWWLVSFMGTIIFAFLFFIHYQFGGGPTLAQELEQATSEMKKNVAANPAPSEAETEESLSKNLKDPKVVELGASVFSSKCAACHGNELQGLVGPNLVDNYWIHGKGTQVDIIKVVRTGVLDKGMLAWENVLKNEEIQAVTAYIFSKKGAKVSNPKPPQGNIVE